MESEKNKQKLKEETEKFLKDCGKIFSFLSPRINKFEFTKDPEEFVIDLLDECDSLLSNQNPKKYQTIQELVEEN